MNLEAPPVISNYPRRAYEMAMQRSNREALNKFHLAIGQMLGASLMALLMVATLILLAGSLVAAAIGFLPAMVFCQPNQLKCLDAFKDLELDRWLTERRRIWVKRFLILTVIPGLGLVISFMLWLAVRRTLKAAAKLPLEVLPDINS